MLWSCHRWKMPCAAPAVILHPRKKLSASLRFLPTFRTIQLILLLSDNLRRHWLIWPVLSFLKPPASLFLKSNRIMLPTHFFCPFCARFLYWYRWVIMNRQPTKFVFYPQKVHLFPLTSLFPTPAPCRHIIILRFMPPTMHRFHFYPMHFRIFP